MMAINVSHDTLNNSDLLAFLYKCDTMNLLKGDNELAISRCKVSCNSANVDMGRHQIR